MKEVAYDSLPIKDDDIIEVKTGKVNDSSVSLSKNVDTNNVKSYYFSVPTLRNQLIIVVFGLFLIGYLTQNCTHNDIISGDERHSNSIMSWWVENHHNSDDGDLEQEKNKKKPCSKKNTTLISENSAEEGEDDMMLQKDEKYDFSEEKEKYWKEKKQDWTEKKNQLWKEKKEDWKNMKGGNWMEKKKEWLKNAGENWDEKKQDWMEKKDEFWKEKKEDWKYMKDGEWVESKKKWLKNAGENWDEKKQDWMEKKDEYWKEKKEDWKNMKDSEWVESKKEWLKNAGESWDEKKQDWKEKKDEYWKEKKEDWKNMKDSEWVEKKKEWWQEKKHNWMDKNGDDDWMEKRKHWMQKKKGRYHQKMHERNHHPFSEENPVTLMPGGGRDWIINAKEGTISPKHDDRFVLGADSHSPLVLVKKGSCHQMKFSQLELERLGEQEIVAFPLLGLRDPDEDAMEYKAWNYRPVLAFHDEEEAKKRETELHQKSASSLEMQYRDDNFLVMKKDGEEKEMVLTVAFWKLKEGMPVHFTSTKDLDDEKETSALLRKRYGKITTFKKGGGSDWVINHEDGTISPKNAPDLALGYGKKHLILAQKGSPEARTFQNLEALANGESATLAFDGREEVVGKQGNEEKEFGYWRYIESSIISSTHTKHHHHGVTVKYLKDNYIVLTSEDGSVDEKSLVLDVKFWKMTKYNSVNFVGGPSFSNDNDNGADEHEDN